MDFKITKLTENEVPQFVDLIESVKWNYSREQIREAWEVFPNDLFAAVTPEGRLLGVAAFVQLDAKTAAFGLYVTQPDVRNQGIGSQVCKAGMESVKHLNLGSFSKIGLEGYYAQKGFKMFNGSVALQGHLTKPEPVPVRDVTLHDVKVDDAESMRALTHFDRDKVNHGSSRELFWKRYIPNCLKSVIAKNTQGEIVGFGCLRTSDWGLRLSPLYAADDQIACHMVDSLVSDVTPGTHVEASVISDTPRMRELFMHYGIGTIERRMTRMFTKANIEVSDYVYTGPNFHTTLW